MIANELKLLPQIKVGSSCTYPNSEYRLCNHKASCAASDVQIYSASVDDSVVSHGGSLETTHSTEHG